ncbi:MAG: redoxin domain-containing protein [Bacteroidota bacterium]
MDTLKFKAFLLLFFAFAYGAIAGNDEGYSIKIKVAGVRDSQCYLANYFGDKQYIHDSARSNPQGMYVFEGKEKLPGGIYLFVLPSHRYFEILIDKDMNFSLETDTLEMVKNMKVKGSNDNKLFYDYLNFITARGKEVEGLKTMMNSSKNKDTVKFYKDKIMHVDTMVMNYKSNYIKDHPASLLSRIFDVSEDPKVPEAPILSNGRKDSLFAFNYYKSHYFDKIPFNDERLLRTPVFHGKLQTYIKDLTLQMPDSINKEADYLCEKAKANKEVFKYVVWWITNHYETSNIMGLDAVFVHMAKTYYTKELATWVDSTSLYKIQERGKTLEPLLLGKQAQYIILQDTMGEFINMHKLKSKYTVLVFWDPDCGHCQKAIPKLVKWYQIAKPLGIEIYAANTAVEEEKWKKFIREKGLNWINVADINLHNNFRHEWDITTTPQIYLLDENKKIIAKRLDPETLADFMKRKLKEDGKEINYNDLDFMKSTEREKTNKEKALEPKEE